MEFWKAMKKGLYWIVVGLLIATIVVLVVGLLGWIFSMAWNESVAKVFGWKQITYETGIWFMILIAFFKPKLNMANLKKKSK